MEGLALFSTPVFTFRDPADADLDRELTQRLVHESEHAPGIARSNSGGWHSVPDLSRRTEPCYQDLMHRIVARVQTMFLELARAQDTNMDLRFRFGVQAWAMVMRHGDHTLIHDHAEAHFSVAYYPDAGDADLAMYPDSGKLSFVDPRRGGTVIPGVQLYPTQFTVQPEAGRMVVFPGWLQHFVQPYRGGRPRICISANVRLEIDPNT